MPSNFDGLSDNQEMLMGARPLRFTPPSGRTFAYASYGDPQGHPVMAFHGTPGSRLKYQVADQTARRLGLRLIAIDRWGYGATPAPEMGAIGLSAFGVDMAAFVAAEGYQRASAVGISGGGPYAAATAVALGPRGTAVALVSPVGPLCGPAVPADVQRNMRPIHKLAFFGAPRLPGVISGAFQGLKLALSASDDFAMRMVTARAHGVDRRIALAAETAPRLARAFRVGLSPGVKGPVIDLKLFSKPWDIDLSALTAKGKVWIGSLDRNVPIDAACALGKANPAIEVERLDGQGHFWISCNFEVVLSWLATTVRAAEPGPSSDGVSLAQPNSSQP